MSFRAVLVAAAITVAVAFSPTARAEKWDMPVAYPESNYHTQNAKQFADEVRKATNGKIDIVVHPSGSLFKGNDIKRAVQTGQAPIGERLLSAHQNENVLFGFDSIPFLATSFEDSERLSAAARPVLEKILNQQNLVVLYTAPWPPQGIYTKKDVNSAADMKGVKIRAYNPATQRIAELLGGVAVQIEEAELSQALATGVVESFFSSGATGYDRKVWEQLSRFYQANAWLPRNFVFVNKDVWQKLDKATQDAIMAAAKAAEQRGLAMAKEYNDMTLKGLADNGMKVQPPSDQLRADLAKIGETMTQEWLQKAGVNGKAILDAYKSGK